MTYVSIDDGSSHQVKCRFAENFVGDYAVIRKKKKAVINRDFDTICPFIFDRISIILPNLITARIDDKIYKIDPIKKTSTEYDYYVYDSWGNGLYFAENELGKCGLIDSNGNAKTDFIYDGLFMAPPVSERYYKEINRDIAIAFISDKFTYLSLDGKFPSHLTFDLGTYFQNDRAIVMKDGKWGVINEKGEFLIPLLYDKIIDEDFGESRDFEHRQIFPLMHGDSKYQANSDFWVLQKFKRILRTLKNNIINASLNGKWGLVDLTGRVINDFKYDYIKYLDSGVATFSSAGKAGLIDTSGRIVLEPKYDYIFISHNGIVTFRNNDLEGIISHTGEILADSMASIGYFFTDIAVVSRNGNYGLINAAGKQVLPLVYDYIKNEYGAIVRNNWEPTNFYLIVNNNKMGLANGNGEVIVPPDKYDYLCPFTSELASFEINKKYGCIDTNGVEIFPPVFSEYIYFKEGIAETEYEGDEVIINMKGEVIFNYTEEKKKRK